MDLRADSIEATSIIVLAAVFSLFALVELIAPARAAVRGRRWVTNLAIFAIDTLAVRLVVPLLMVGAAQLAQARGWGLFNRVELAESFGIVIAVLALDLALYWQHRIMHRVPLLWRLHKVHHSDPHFDVTTAARFHPLEIIASMLYKMAVVVALGLPAIGVALFELVFAMATLFTHANFALPRVIEGRVRGMFVTPDMHRIHHSTEPRETDSNFGTLLSAWDRLFRTMTERAAAGAEGMAMGLAEYRDASPYRLGWSLLLPFRK